MFAPWRILMFVSRPWRLIPELDRFSDEQCAQYAGSLAAERFTGLVIAAVTALLVGVTLTMLAIWFVETRLEPTFEIVSNRDGIAFRIVWLITAAFVIGTTLWLALTPYLLLIRRGLLRRLDLATCPSCSYSLLGLPIRDGIVTCPECGRDVVLRERGLREEDLLSAPAAPIVDSPQEQSASQPRMVARGITGGAALLTWLVFGWNALLPIAFVLGVVYVVAGIALADPPDKRRG